MLRLALALAVTAALLGAAPAVGAEFPDAATFIGIAQRTWAGQSPQCGPPHLLDVRDRTVNGPMESALSLGTVAEATTSYDQCGVLWDSANRWRPTPYGWCVVIVHEYGHLIGHDHNGNRRSVMYVYGPWYAHVPACDQYRSPSGCTTEVTMHGRSYHPLCSTPPRRDLATMSF